MNYEPDQAELEREQELVYGLLNEVEVLANGTKYSPGKVPTTLIFQSPNNDGERLTGIRQQPLAVGGGQSGTETFDLPFINVLFAEISEGLDYQTAERSGGGHHAPGGLLEPNIEFPNTDALAPSIGQINSFGWNLIA